MPADRRTPIEATVERWRQEMGLPAEMDPLDVVSEGVRRADARYAGQLAAARQTGAAPPEPRPGAPMAHVLDWAELTGRIASSSRPDWERNWAQAGQRTEATVRVLAAVRQPPPSTVWAHAAAPRQTASGMDVSILPPMMRAAAARTTDRAQVVRWIEDYGGMTDEEAAPALYMCDRALAMEIEQDRQYAAAAAQQAQNMDSASTPQPGPWS